MKKIVSIITLTVLSILFLLTNVHVHAEDSTTGVPSTSVTASESETETPRVSSSVSPTEENHLLNEAETASQRFTRAKAKADKYITERISALNREISSIKASKYASSTTSQSLITMLTNDINGLTALKTQIDALTSPTQLTTLLADIKEIFVNFRIYEVELPKAVGLMHLQAASGILTNLTVVQKDMSDDIAYAQSQNLSTTTIQADAAAFNTDVTKLSSDITAANTLLNSFTPASYSTKGNIVSQIKTTFANLHQDVQKVRQDFKKFKEDYLALFKLTEPTTTETETPTPSV